MRPIPCRVLPHRDGDGPANMALDESLLELVADDPDGGALLRTYGWSVPTLSLGYFQRTTQYEDDPRWRGAEVVRRPTGGGALWHHHELTYALVIPRTHPLARRPSALYRAVHEALTALLAEAGVDARRRGEVADDAAETDPRPFLCFLDRDAEDLMVGPSKVVGSAQRRRSGAVLQHGSLLLRRSDRTPELVGVADLSPAADDPLVWSRRVADRVPVALGLAAAPTPWAAGFLEAAADLERRIYRADAWTRRR